MISPTLSEPIIACEGISVSFSGSHGKSQAVLASLDLVVDNGTIVTLLGRSGCGKSTLLRVMAGLIAPQSGTVTVDGKSFQTDRRHVQSMMSFVFQEAALLPWRSVMENVQLPLELRGQGSSAQIREVCEHWLQIVGLNESDWRKRPSQLSGGMKMRASIARAMTTSPRILLMDEPFAALDDVLRSKLNDLLLKIAETESCTVVFVTHNISEAVYLSDAIAVMDQGRIAQTVRIAFPQERNAKLRATPSFSETYGRVSDILFQLDQTAVP
jgi:NitT/TauT family transport system ATP-binding protein